MRQAISSILFLVLTCQIPLQVAIAQEGGVLKNNTMAASSYGSIRGTVLDGSTGDPLAFVHVILPGTKLGTVTGADGSFEISTLPAGHYDLVLSYVGYTTDTIRSIIIKPGIENSILARMAPFLLALGELQVTATRKLQSAALVPASSSVIKAQDLTSRNLKTFDQVFDQVPGVQLTRSSGANVQALSIRGASEVAGGGVGNRVLLLVDGRPAVSPETGGALWNLVPLNAVGRIEVVKGPFSSLYGSSAMGGVVNVMTRAPDAQARSNFHLNYGFYGNAPKSSGYKEFGAFRTIEFTHGQSMNDFSFLVAMSHKKDDGHREKSSFVLNTLFAKLQYRLPNYRKLGLSVSTSWIDNDSPATWLSTRQAYFVAEHRKDDVQRRRELSFDFIYEAIPGAKVKYSSHFYAYLNRSRYTFDADPQNDSTNVNFGKQTVEFSRVIASRVGNISQIDLLRNSRHYFIGGTDLKIDFTNGFPDTVLYGKQKTWEGGLFLQDEFTPNTKLTITTGIRFDYHQIVSEFQTSAISPKLSVLYKLNERVTIRALVGQSFRYPSVAERFIKFEQGGGLRFQPNPQLKNERLTISSEAGARVRLGKLGFCDVALYYNRYEELISFKQLSAPGKALLFQVVNLKRAVMQGFECSLNLVPAEIFRLQLTYSFLDARDISPERLNDALAYKARHTFGYHFNVELGDLNLSMSGRSRSKIEEVFIYPGSEPRGYFLLNTKTTYAFGSYQIYFAVNNLTDTLYEELERYRMAGRNFTLGLAVEL